jgi:hypothetical protein
MAVSAAETDVAAAFAELAETLVSGIDIDKYLADVCRHSVTFIGADMAALVYATGEDPVRVAAGDESGYRLAVRSLEATTSPWAECIATGVAFSVTDLTAESQRWPWFVQVASQAGLRAITVLPVRSLLGVTGALALIGGPVPDVRGIRLARSLCDAAGYGMLVAEHRSRLETAVSQLQQALSSRIVIEQAKGILAERWKVAPDEAFRALRRHARTTQRRLADVAHAIIDGTADLLPPDRAKRS